MKEAIKRFFNDRDSMLWLIFVSYATFMCGLLLFQGLSYESKIKGGKYFLIDGQIYKAVNVLEKK